MMALAEFISSASRTYAATHRLPIGTAFGGSPKSRLGAINLTLSPSPLSLTRHPSAVRCHHQYATLNVGLSSSRVRRWRRSPGGGDVRVTEPFLYLGDVGFVVERIGGGRRAARGR